MPCLCNLQILPVDNAALKFKEKAKSVPSKGVRDVHSQDHEQMLRPLQVKGKVSSRVEIRILSSKQGNWYE